MTLQLARDPTVISCLEIMSKFAISLVKKSHHKVSDCPISKFLNVLFKVYQSLSMSFLTNEMANSSKICRQSQSFA